MALSSCFCHSKLVNVASILYFFLLTTLASSSPFLSAAGHPQGVVGTDGEATQRGKKWALLVAGSRYYYNYRHQADICHAYQFLKSGGLKDENIIVFMYDDIANHSENPRPGVIVNQPNGPDVYHGVPKDYTGKDANGENFFAVLRANRTAITGGSGKVLMSGPEDIVFIYYAGHGAAGVIGMPDDTSIYGIDIVDTLKDLYAAKSYKKMVIYVEACESGSLFEGLLPNDINIYATTASNAIESSYAYYCVPEYSTCLGDMYSISWMEDSEKHNLTRETLKQQYETVRRRTLAAENASSHVMQYGDLSMDKDCLHTYFSAHHATCSHGNNIKFAYLSHVLLVIALYMTMLHA